MELRTVSKDMLGAVNPRRAAYTPVYDSDGLPFGYLLHDSSDDTDSREVYCLKIGEPRHSGNIFLVLVRHDATDAPSARFRRIGLGYTADERPDFFEEPTLKL
jgi:hypothetical protein